MLLCPVCAAPLIRKDRVASCSNGHCYDIAKEGYLNLLRSSKSGDKIGDDKESARSRRDFLNKGYYALLQDQLKGLFADKRGAVLDICCGEGYYARGLAENPNLQVYGFDISREMVRLASKRGGVICFVANMANIPVPDNAFDYAIHLFAPFHESEFCRILKPSGRLYSVVPGSHHLFGLKQALYDTPYINDEKLPDTQSLRLIGTQKITGKILLANKTDMDAVFRMTPYYFHTSQKDKAKLEAYDTLETPIEFVIAEYEKEG